MITQTTRATVLNLVRSGNYTINEILDECEIGRKTFRMILKKAGYPIPSNNLRITSSNYRSLVQSKVTKQKNLWDIDTPTIGELRKKLKAAQDKFRKELIDKMLKENANQAEALNRLRREI